MTSHSRLQQSFSVYREAVESKEALEVAKAREAAAETKHKEADAKLAGLLAREQAVADYKQQHAAAVQATEAADQVCHNNMLSRNCHCTMGYCGLTEILTRTLVNGGDMGKRIEV